MIWAQAGLSGSSEGKPWVCVLIGTNTKVGRPPPPEVVRDELETKDLSTKANHNKTSLEELIVNKTARDDGLVALASCYCSSSSWQSFSCFRVNPLQNDQTRPKLNNNNSAQVFNTVAGSVVSLNLL